MLRILALPFALAATGCGILPESSPARAHADLREALSPPIRDASVAQVASRAAGPLTLETVLESVERSHPLVVAALQEREAAAGRRLTAEGAFDLGVKGRASWMPDGFYETYETGLTLEQPTRLWGASFTAGYKLSEGNFSSWDGGRKTNRGGEVRLGAKVPLLRDGPIDRARAGIRQAEIDERAVDVNIQRTLIELSRRATREYWSWVAAGRRLGVAETLLALAEARADAVKESAERGDIPALEETDNDRLIAQRRAIVAASRRAFEQASIELGLYVRDENGVPVPLDRSRVLSTVPAPDRIGTDRDRLVALAVEARPELRRFELLLERARVDLDLARNQSLPGLDAFVAGSQDLRTRPYADKAPFELEAGILLDVPLERRAARGRERTARALLRTLASEARFAGDRIAAEVQDALSAILRASERVEETRRAATLAKRLEEAERVAFEQGISTILVVNLREQASADAHAVEIDALADYHRARADLKAALGLWQKDVE